MALTQLDEFSGAGSYERDEAHEADMRELRKEQLAADCGDEPCEWGNDPDDDFCNDWE